MYKSKFKNREEAEAYYDTQVGKLKSSKKFKDHYAKVAANATYKDQTIEYIPEPNYPLHTAVEVDNSGSVPLNTIVLDEGIVHI